VGTIGQLAAFSFNGNKMITTSAGGMLLATDPALVARGRKLATQAREQAPHYEHLELGYNYRMSNLLAALGLAQLRHLDERVAARRRNFAWYRQRLREVPGLELMPAAAWGRHTRWLTTITVVPAEFGADPVRIRRALAADRIESRPIWKPMHLQPVFRGAATEGGDVAEDLFDRGLCLPSGSELTEPMIDRIVGALVGSRVPVRQAVAL
jgi:pyridoxal phosphate-dependent aminotransferase EpsN